MNHALTHTCEALEQALGDPHDPASPSGFARSLAADEAETFPQAGFAALLELHYLDRLVPRALGGSLERFEDLLQIARLVARRDLSLAIATGQSLLGALPVWIAGSPAQQAALAQLLRSGASGALALTEENHGSDLAASGVHAHAVEAGYALRGTKWCINNGTRGRYLTVLARTAEAGGNRAFSLLFVDKAQVDHATIVPLAKLRTHGLRGADISGITFEGTLLARTSLIGKEGHGLDLVFRTMQVSRTLCSAFSLGAADTALRLATEFARTRSLYGATAYDIPTVRAGLGDAFVTLLLADVLAHMASRALSVLPEQMSVYSAVVKVLVPELCNEVIEGAARVLGARHYLREGRYGMFQKLRRDAAVVALFDGSSAVNRTILAGQLHRLCSARAEERSLRGAEQGERARLALDLSRPTPGFDLRALKTSSRGRDDIVGGLDDTIQHLAALLSSSTPLLARARALLRARDSLDAAVCALPDEQLAGHGEELSALASRYVWLVAGASCLHHLAAGTADTQLTQALCTLALSRVLRELAPGDAAELPADAAARARLEHELLGRCAEPRMLGLRAVRLADSTALSAAVSP